MLRISNAMLMNVSKTKPKCKLDLFYFCFFMHVILAMQDVMGYSEQAHYLFYAINYEHARSYLNHLAS